MLVKGFANYVSYDVKSEKKSPKDTQIHLQK